MSEFVLTDVLPLVGGLNFQGVGNQVSAVHSAELRDKTAWGDTSRRRIAGLENLEVSLQCYWDSPPDAELFAAIAAAAQPFTLAPTNTALGSAVVAAGLHGEYSLGATIGDIFAFGVTMQGDSVVAAGILAQEPTTETTNDFSTGSQMGTLTAAQRMYANLHVTAASGTSPTLDVIIQSDEVGFGSPTTRITFAQAVAIGGQHLSVAGAVTPDDYWRAGWTIGGSDTPTFTFAVALAIK